MQSAFKDRLKSFLENEQLVPKPLIFLTRCMRMLQASNQILGSPVNRINLLAESAASGLAVATATSRRAPLWTRLQAVIKVVRFKTTLAGMCSLIQFSRMFFLPQPTFTAIDFVFWASYYYNKLFRRGQVGFEDMYVPSPATFIHGSLIEQYIA